MVCHQGARLGDALASAATCYGSLHGAPLVSDLGEPRARPDALGCRSCRALGHPPDTALTLARWVAGSSARAFGDHLTEVRAAMEALAASMPREELNRVGFRLYEAFRPSVPEGIKGWGVKAELRLDRIRQAGRHL